MYWDQWEISTQVDAFDRVWAHIQRNHNISSAKEIYEALPPVLQAFHPKYLQFKATIDEYDRTSNPNEYLLKQSLVIKNLEFENLKMKSQMDSMSDQLRYQSMSNPKEGKGSSSSTGVLPEEVKEQRSNIFKVGVQSKRGSSGIQRQAMDVDP